MSRSAAATRPVPRRFGEDEFVEDPYHAPTGERRTDGDLEPFAVPSSNTVRTRIRRPSYSASAMKSRAHVAWSTGGASSG